MASKQVLIIKKFPNLRTGKYCAQASHASVGALLSIGQIIDDKLVIPLENKFIKDWITGNFKKVTLYVNTDTELMVLHQAAVVRGLPSALITDAGLTEFNGVKTLTALGIGPWDENELNSITGHLPLF